MVPRRPERGEHVDDHQLQLAKRFAERGLVVSAEVEAIDEHLLDEAASKVATQVTPPPFDLLERPS